MEPKEKTFTFITREQYLSLKITSASLTGKLSHESCIFMTGTVHYCNTLNCRSLYIFWLPIFTIGFAETEDLASIWAELRHNFCHRIPPNKVLSILFSTAQAPLIARQEINMQLPLKFKLICKMLSHSMKPHSKRS